MINYLGGRRLASCTHLRYGSIEGGDIFLCIAQLRLKLADTTAKTFRITLLQSTAICTSTVIYTIILPYSIIKVSFQCPVLGVQAIDLILEAGAVGLFFIVHHLALFVTTISPVCVFVILKFQTANASSYFLRFLCASVLPLVSVSSSPSNSDI